MTDLFNYMTVLWENVARHCKIEILGVEMTSGSVLCFRKEMFNVLWRHVQNSTAHCKLCWRENAVQDARVS